MTAVEFGRLSPRRSQSRAAALASLSAQLEQLLERLAPDVAVVETPVAGRFPQAVLALAEARGALLAVLGRWGGPVVELAPAQVKLAVVGNGRAEKRQVAFVVRHALARPEEPPPDAADALALALCHVRAGLP